MPSATPERITAIISQNGNAYEIQLDFFGDYKSSVALSGHFALETHCDEIAAAIRNFFSRSN